ncbi:sterigmatocystin biosynthesis P450 monooxygenase stcF [Salix suchowensis]|nr:sterigmatocystin biosynthesis P450 monooxygenase stcF [Salix suchowensis]
MTVPNTASPWKTLYSGNPFPSLPARTTHHRQSRFAPVKIEPPANTSGFNLTFQDGRAAIDYFPAYDEVDLREGSQLALLLATQLRVSNILFWLHPTFALAITDHVSVVTSNSTFAAAINLQANALLNQLNADAARGTTTEYAALAYAPSLTIDTYIQGLNGAIDTLGAFQSQYDRFVDNAASIAIQAEAWDTMLQRSQDVLTTQMRLAQEAYDKFQSAIAILNDCENASKNHQRVLGDASRDFRLGLEIWQREQMRKQAFLAIKIAFSIAILATGNPASIGDILETVVEAGETISEIAKISDSVKQLQDVVQTLNMMWASTLKTVEVMMQIKNNPDWDVSTSAGDVQASAVLVAMTGIAAWDVWRLEIEDAIQAAVDEDIGGARKYLLELRKHSINGKLLCMARAQFKHEETAAKEASIYFWDRLTLLNTGVLTMMRNVIWAYRYYALRDSSVVLSPIKSVADYKADSQTLRTEVINWQEGFSSAPSPYEYHRTAEDLPLNYGPAVIASLKETSHATFTLNPPPELARPFVGGGRFRTFGLRVYLDGARPKPLQAMAVGYRISQTGETKIEIDSIIPSDVYADPTPLTQWTIAVTKPDTVDLSGLTDVRLEWKGNAYYDTRKQRYSPIIKPSPSVESAELTHESTFEEIPTAIGVSSRRVLTVLTGNDLGPVRSDQGEELLMESSEMQEKEEVKHTEVPIPWEPEFDSSEKKKSVDELEMMEDAKESFSLEPPISLEPPSLVQRRSITLRLSIVDVVALDLDLATILSARLQQSSASRRNSLVDSGVGIPAETKAALPRREQAYERDWCDAAMTLFNRFRKEASAACSGVSSVLGSKREVLGTKGNTEREHAGSGPTDGEDSIFEMVQSTLRRYGYGGIHRPGRRDADTESYMVISEDNAVLDVLPMSMNPRTKRWHLRSKYRGLSKEEFAEGVLRCAHVPHIRRGMMAMSTTTRTVRRSGRRRCRFFGRHGHGQGCSV